MVRISKVRNLTDRNNMAHTWKVCILTARTITARAFMVRTKVRAKVCTPLFGPCLKGPYYQGRYSGQLCLENYPECHQWKVLKTSSIHKH